MSSFVVVSIIIAYYSNQHKIDKALYMHGYATATGLSWTIQKHTTTYIGRPLVPSWVRLECPEEPKLDPQNKKIKLRRFALPPMNGNDTGGLRMIIGRAGNKNLPVLSAGWSY